MPECVLLVKKLILCFPRHQLHVDLFYPGIKIVILIPGFICCDMCRFTDACSACLWLHWKSNASCDVVCICRSAVTAAAAAVDLIQVARRRVVHLAQRTSDAVRAFIITVSVRRRSRTEQAELADRHFLFIMIAFRLRYVTRDWHLVIQYRSLI